MRKKLIKPINNRGFKIKNKPAILFLSLLVSATLIMGSAFSWFVASDTEVNTLRAKQTNFLINVVDIFTEPEEPIIRDKDIEKIVGAKNNGSRPGFVRLLVHPTIQAADGTVLPVTIGKEITLDLNTTDWMYGEDGYYYYLRILQPGEETPNLFTKVKFTEIYSTLYTNATFKIEIKCEAVGIEKWDYRESFWGSDGIPNYPDNEKRSEAHVAIDTELSKYAV